MADIRRAEAKIQKDTNNPDYQIDVKIDGDGTIHYNTGNAKNRELLHKNFVETFDKKLQKDQTASATLGGQSGIVQHHQPTASQAAATAAGGDDAKSSPN